MWRLVLAVNDAVDGRLGVAALTLEELDKIIVEILWLIISYRCCALIPSFRWALSLPRLSPLIRLSLLDAIDDVIDD